MRREKIGVFIDEIEYIYENIFSLHLILDINSEYFIPAHTRYFNVRSELLEREFLAWTAEHNPYFREQNRGLDGIGIGSVVQGGYYYLPSEWIYNRQRPANTEYFSDDEMFGDGPAVSPYVYEDTRQTFAMIEELNDSGRKSGMKTFLYCFYVGQGDMFLLITTAGNAYIIDTNIYSRKDLSIKIKAIKEILARHKMDMRKIKGFIVTHKHIDHIRGANQLIDSGEFDIEYFLMNFGYPHPTAAVHRLLQSAKKNIAKWIDINQPCTIRDGGTKICFRNPDSRTRLAPDINDSSIVMCIMDKENHMYLTGDTSASVLERVMNCKCLQTNSEALLKVSHHGSKTGISQSVLNMLIPKKAFISAGNSKKYGHPHVQCTNMLNASNVDTVLSKDVKQTVEYCLDGKKTSVKLV